MHDPDQVPLPPEETRIQTLEVEPWPDGRRASVELQLTPFQQRPNVFVRIRDEQGQEVASVGAIQVTQRRLAFTLHLRPPATQGQYSVTALLVYPEEDLKAKVVHRVEATLEISETDSPPKSPSDPA